MLAPKDKIPVQQKMQEAVTNWEGLLNKATGSTLVPEKCFGTLSNSSGRTSNGSTAQQNKHHPHYK